MTVTASSLAVDYTRLLREFCRFADYDADNMTATQEADWNDVLATAINQVLHPPLVPTLKTVAHQWSWMRPLWKQRTAADQKRYTLPVTFERFHGDIYFDESNNAHYGRIEHRPVGRVLDKSQDVSTGVPSCYSIETLPSEGTTEQQRQLVLHPTPDAEYDLIAQYQIGGMLVSADNPYPPGGPELGELWVASVLAAAEAKLDDNPDGTKYKAFLTRLMADVANDLQKQPPNLGYMGDGKWNAQSSRSHARRLFNLTSGYTTYDGGLDL